MKKILLEYFREIYQCLNFRNITEAIMMIIDIGRSKLESVKLITRLIEKQKQKAKGGGCYPLGCTKLDDV